MFSSINNIFENISDKFRDIALLLARVLVAYGFLEPALSKWRDIEAVAGWFESMDIPFPLLNTYMAASTEILGVALLTLGLLTRYISIPLIVIMIVAIFTVHLSNGFAAGDNGFEIPLYYMSFLLLFVSIGGGKYSLDNYLFKKD